MAEIAPVTLEGWFALHQVFRIDRSVVAATEPRQRSRLAETLQSSLAEALGMARTDATGAGSADGDGPMSGGWTEGVELIGGGADLMLVHFRPTFEDLARIQQELRRGCCGTVLRLQHDFVSVTEAALYGATREAAEEASHDTPEYERRLNELVAAERAGPRMTQRLYPHIPADMRYACFYPMSKRRIHPDNWYLLPLVERDRLMREHGLTGRRFAGRLVQVITGAIGFDEWEWGVTLFARDPLVIKRAVTEMRYDEASARYAEFGTFYTGIRLDASGLKRLLGA